MQGKVRKTDGAVRCSIVTREATQEPLQRLVTASDVGDSHFRHKMNISVKDVDSETGGFNPWKHTAHANTAIFTGI